jgi:predicted O-linked N-acetylglucosamine transferase (SPINDLY family)
MDYILADSVVIPESSRTHYVEKVVHLPFSYQANDQYKPLCDTPVARGDHGLPEGAFVYCCFNNNYKITPHTFRMWMDILKAVEGSCLWLLEDNPGSSANLKKHAQQAGIDPERLIFAQRVPIAEHLNRHRLADLFLDTLPYNAHTTASDALWAGLPLLTLKGSTFPGRVAASLLTALQAPELITESEEAFKQAAIHAARDPQWLAQIRHKVAEQRLKAPLFDTPRMTKYLEEAFMAMHERHQAGQTPDHMTIDP